MSFAAILVLTLTVGLPCTLLAAAIVYHGRVANGMPAADAGWAPDQENFSPPTFALPVPEADHALIALQQTVAEVRDQLAHQRVALTDLLSDRERAAESSQTPTRGAFPVILAEADEVDIPGAVRRLTAEGLSERAIARRLRIGLEEVRLASRRERVS